MKILNKPIEMKKKFLWQNVIADMKPRIPIDFESIQEQRAFLQVGKRIGVKVTTRKQDGHIYGWRLFPEAKS